ncbi:hypothetical protein MRX96_041547 [Rhipicephalus microplus]
MVALYIIQEGGEFAERLSHTYGFVQQQSGRTAFGPANKGLCAFTPVSGALETKESGGIDDLISEAEGKRGGCKRERSVARAAVSLSLQYGQTIFRGPQSKQLLAPRHPAAATGGHRVPTPPLASARRRCAPGGGGDPWAPFYARPGCAPFIFLLSSRKDGPQVPVRGVMLLAVAVQAK